ncbi:hypothetical protein POM88_043604 [Heracleum sosnowskyi]|uniref:Uncharacterized protein n=1 Tax=Heracleum sosnowskyi TaxID=360622 RepID=A0AAD8M259_9APIA|nr:hypothetical protein POM88_043604 [Heracleum sosnowskyi]
MAANRSPSPLQTRPTTNPNLRASETNSSIRRSFTGNPFSRPLVHTSPRSFVPNTPANSPAEFGRKLSIGKEGSLRGFEEKENEKVHNLKAIKCKSPLKASKNFMSPTISAASKFTPSPRKKILGERNETIRTSISFSDGQESSVSDIDLKSESGFNQNTVEGLSDLAGFHKKEVLKASKRVTFSDEVLPIARHESSPYNSFDSSSMSPVITPYEVSETPNKAEKQSDYDSVNLDFSLDFGPFSSPAIAPLDADPSFPPYDPKTNYLSPRPQFLRYKPNRRMEFEDADTEETESGGSQKESEDGSSIETLPSEEAEALLLSEPTPADTEETESGGSQKESEDGSSIETLPSEEAEALLLSEPTPAETPISDQMLKRIFEAKADSFTISESEEEELLVSEPILTGSPISTGMLEPMVEAQSTKPGFFSRTKCIFLILMLLIACASVSFMDVSITPPVIKDSSFYKLYESSEFAALARKKIDRLAGLAGNFRHWYDSTEIAVFARENFDGLFDNFQQWYESSDLALYANKYLHSFVKEFKQYSSQAIFYLYKLIPRLGKEDRSIYVRFSNLTDLQEHSSEVGYFEVNCQKKVAEIHDEYELEFMVKEEAGRDNVEEMAYSASVINEQYEEESEVQRMIPAEVNHSETAEEVLDAEQMDTELQSKTRDEDQSADVNEHNEEESEVLKIIQAEMLFYPESNTGEVLNLEKFESNTESKDPSIIDSSDSIDKSEVDAPGVITPTEFVCETEFSIADRNSESKSEVVSEVAEKKPFVHAIFGISFLVLAVMVASAFTYLKQGKNATAVNVVTNSEMSGESCPSAMSTSSYSKGSLKKINKAQSQERKSRAANTKRESLSSSSEFSTGSPSYGSFTTYERIPLKHAYGEEEIVTPVRRSSRIRSQITSP